MVRRPELGMRDSSMDSQPSAEAAQDVLVEVGVVPIEPVLHNEDLVENAVRIEKICQQHPEYQDILQRVANKELTREEGRAAIDALTVRLEAEGAFVTTDE